MAVLLEGAVLPKPDVHTKSPEASENPLQLRAVMISILYKIMPRTAQFPTGQGSSLEILLSQPSSPRSADPGRAHLGGPQQRGQADCAAWLCPSSACPPTDGAGAPEVTSDCFSLSHTQPQILFLVTLTSVSQHLCGDGPSSAVQICTSRAATATKQLRHAVLSWDTQQQQEGVSVRALHAAQAGVPSHAELLSGTAGQIPMPGTGSHPVVSTALTT